MTQLTAPSIIDRLGALRRRVRTVVTLRGLGLALAAFAGGALILGLLDYSLHLNSYLRLILLLAGLAALALLITRHLIHPLRQPLPDSFLAGRVETLRSDLADDVTSAVHFIGRDAGKVNALAARSVAQAEERARAIDFSKAVDQAPALRAMSIGLLLAAILTVIALAAPSLFGIGVARWLSPFGNHDWPRTTTVSFDWSLTGGEAPKVWPIGEPLPVRASVTRGYYKNLRVTLYTGSDTQSPTDDLMTLQSAQSNQSAGIFEKIVDPSGNNWISLRLEAGDDDEQDAIRIRLAPRPELVSLTAQITPPPYVHDPADPTKPGPATQFDLRMQSARAYEGGAIAILIKSKKPLATDSHGQPILRFLEQTTDADLPIPNLATSLVDTNTAQITFPATKSIQARIQIKDTDGFDNRVGGRASIDVLPDALPNVIITEPRRQVEIIPTGQIALLIQANDDLGLTDLILRADPFDAKPADSPDTPNARANIPLPWTTLSPDGSGRAQSTWDLTSLNLKPGDRLSVYAMVRDNYSVTDAAGKTIRHPWVRSAPVSVTILTEEQIRENLRHQLTGIRDQIRSLITQQSDTNAKTRALQKTIEQSGISTPEQKHELADLTAQQAQQAQRAMAIESQTAEIQAAVAQNKMQDDELGKLAKDVREGMKEVGQQDMPKAAEELSHAQETAAKKDAAQQTAQSADKAGQQQETALATMDALVSKLGAAGDFEALRSKVEQLLKDQKALNQRTREAAAASVGLKPEELPQNVKDELNAIAKEQQKLSDQTRSVTSQMDRAAADLQKSDPASSESLSKASAAAARNQVAPAQSSAASNAQDNKIANASNDQAQATRGLEEMMDELDQQNRRQLEQLARQLEQLIQVVTDLLHKQQALATDTVAAGEKAGDDVLTPLGDRQGRLQTNTLTVAAQAEALRDGRPVAADLRNASDAMIDATAALNSTKQPPALQPQQTAITDLKAALDKLQKQLDEANKQLKDDDLATLIKQYQEIEKSQEAVKTASDAIAARKAARGEILRPDLLDLARQAIMQSKLADEVTALSSNEKLKEFGVVVWVNSLILDAMADSKVKLTHADVGPDLADAQQTAIDRLNDVINALKEEKKRNSEFQGGGGGGGGGGKQPLVPPLAELKLLKAMQTVVNNTTAKVDQKLTAATTDEQREELKEQATHLGQSEDKIKSLAGDVVKKLQQ